MSTHTCLHPSSTNQYKKTHHPAIDYSKMFAMQDATGKPLFESISITLVCDDCLKTDEPEKYDRTQPCIDAKRPY